MIVPCGRCGSLSLPPSIISMPAKKKKSNGEAPRPRGRPAIVWAKKGKAKAKAVIESLFGSGSPAPASESSALEPASGAGGVVLSAEQARMVLLAGEEYGVPSDPRPTKSTPYWLQNIAHEENGQTLVAVVRTEDLPKWFHDQKNDYQPKDHDESQIVELTWFGHPGDSPHDIRARKLVVRWVDHLHAEHELRIRAIKEVRPVWRWNYWCTGVHDRPEDDEEEDFESNDGEGGGAEDVDSNADEDGGITSDSSGSAQLVRRGRWERCQSGVRLQFEITADDLAVAKIWQKNQHNDVSPKQLKLLMFSRLLRLQIMDRFRRYGYGSKATTVQQDLVQQFLLPNSSGTSDSLPQHRVPSTTQIRAMLSTSRQQIRMHRNPFHATHLMVKRNARDMYFYTPHDFNQPDDKSNFAVAITDDFSLDSTLLNTEGPNGTLFMDSTHRLHNENRAATTVLCTANEAKHVMPGVYLISANIKARTIKGWFVETIRKLEARSREIADDKTKILYRDTTTVNRLFDRSQHIAANGFDFMNINIDKSRSEYNGITEALRELGIRNYCIRLCQFHVVFAILRFDFDDGAHGLGFSVPVAIKAQILVLFRILQRCRSRDRWDDAKRTFYAGLQALLGDVDTETMAQAAAAEQAVGEEAGSTSQSKQGNGRKRRGTARPRTKAAKAAGRSFFEVVKEYFDKNWFIEPWIDSFTDIGMPPGQSRDDTWNTNNFAETAFKQFNAIFLGNKHNKRIDQLASIILNHHLPFFRFFPTPDRPLSKELVALHHSANRLWETEMVDATTDTETFTVSRIDARQLIKHTVVLSPLSCTCNHYQQTGKACVDIIAARLMRSNGPAKSWKDVEARTEKRVITTRTKRGKKGHRAQKLPHDETVFSEVTNSFQKLRAWEEEEKSNELEPSFGEFQVVTSSGRPANAKPLRPWRRKQVYAAAGRYGYSPRFVKKRGPAKRSRLHWNSLLPAFRRNNNPRRAAYMHHVRRHAMMGVLALNNVDAASKSVQNPTTAFNIQTNISAASGEFAAPNDNDEFLNAEDHALTQLNGLQWINDDYELRLDEMGVFLAFFNACSIAIDNGIIFLCGGVDNPFAAALRSMDWTQPLSVEQLRQGHMSVLADLVASRRNNHVKHIIFFDVRYHHWTTFYHSLATNPPALSWFNTLRQPDVETPPGDIQDQIVLHQFFLRFRPQGPPMQVPVPLHPIYLDLQQDSYTCGFWVVYLGLSFLLDFEPINSAARDLNIKELVCPIYIAFLADEHGVPVSLLYNLVTPFRPRVDLSQLPPDTIISYRPILFSMCLASMLDPSLATHTAKDISNARIRIANRLNQAIRSCDQNAKALRQSVSRVPTPTPSQQHSLRGRFPHGCT
ncbi:hypothetical protein DFH08DRAFT_488600 [Mycena albidolilacea]|uniref:SWIM-type domain-containing protein n=1 Tax=Mycena albidolilacea TaxID=1033008 RepID=A0AAD6Z628_9AGAR|nr:hypothetical protein DFH08DRAFT_488600 [Mycena albidolilacea]